MKGPAAHPAGGARLLVRRHRILTSSYGFLEGLGYPRLSMFTVWPMLAVLWIVGFVAVAGSAHAAGQRA